MITNVRSVLGIVSRRIDNTTVVVLVETIYQHKMYKKFIKKVTKLLVHDEEGVVQAGDNVKIVSTRPYSRRKSWKLLNAN